MQKTVYQTPELRDSNDNIIQQGAFGKNTALSNSTNDGWIDYVMNNLEALHDVVGETSPTLDANGHVVEPANLAIGDEDGNRIKESYLKLSGGKVTGIASFRTDLRMLDNQDNRWGGLYVPGTTASEQYLSLYAGTRAVGDARLNLYNVGNGKFELTGYSTDGANTYTLTHDNSGNLNWRGYPLAWKKDYLPLAGGTMSGEIVHSNGVATRSLNDSSSLQIFGGTSNNKGGLIALYGKDYSSTSYAGAFVFAAHNGTDSKYLEGFPSGVLRWGGNNIALAKDYLPLNGGTMRSGISFSVGLAISRNVNNDSLSIYGGTNYLNGAYLSLSGKDSSGNGRFALNASNGNVIADLIGTADGTLKWKGQTIQTSSDKRLKRDFSNVPADVLEAWGKVNWQQFKYIDDAERKGVNNCRWHTGLVAQDVKEIGEENNVDLLRYGILCHDVRRATAEQGAVDLWTVRYEEALAMEAAYQRRRADMLEERIARLEALLTNTETEVE
jgi:hypothetical protein